MTIKIFKTFEITDDYWKQIVTGYNESFERENITAEQLKLESVSNYFGYSYHALCITENDQVVGFNSITPNYYFNSNKEKIKVGLSGSVYVLKEYRRDIFILEDMFMKLREHCKGEGMIILLGVPNENAYNYNIKFLKFKHAFSLPYYIFPKNIFSIIGNGKYSFLNLFSKLGFLMNLLLSYLLSFIVNTKEKRGKYRILQDDTFLLKRFQDNKYKTINVGSIGFTYAIHNENNIKTVYLMHFSQDGQKSFRALVKAVYYIFFSENFDLILYVGTLNIKQTLLLKVPGRFEPKKLRFTYDILNVENKNDFKNINIKGKWDFSLMNLDVR